MHELKCSEGKHDLMSPVQQVETRWNTIHLSTIWFLNLKDKIPAILCKCNRLDLLNERERIKVLEDLVKILKPFLKATGNISWGQCANSSTVVPISNLLFINSQYDLCHCHYNVMSISWKNEEKTPKRWILPLSSSFQQQKTIHVVAETKNWWQAGVRSYLLCKDFNDNYTSDFEHLKSIPPSQ